jgi:threonine synthase
MVKNLMLRCSGCGKQYSFGTYSCECNTGVLLAEYNFKHIQSINEIEDPSKSGIWRFSKVLPDVKDYFSFNEGGTPCIKSQKIGPQNNILLYIKDEGRNPTGSFRDRAATVLVSTEKELGHSSSTTASSGNAAGSLSLYSTLANMNLYIFMYQPTEGKFLHTLSFGHKLFLVDSPIESDAHRMAEEASRKFGWSLLTTMSSANPFNIEGYKTISYEIIRDIGLPDVVIIPMGSGTLVLGIWKGFKEIYKMGIISKIPCLIGIQSEQINPIEQAYQRGETTIRAVTPGKTIASGVVVDNPGIAGTVALKAIRETEGFVISISEERILDAFELLPKEEGIFAEPTGALSIAGLKFCLEEKVVSEGQKVVCINSASGFKDLNAFKKIKQTKFQVKNIPPNLDSVEEILNANNSKKDNN